VTDDVTQESAPPSGGFGWKQVVALVITLIVLVVVFAVVLPQLGDYQQAWAAIQNMSTAWVVGLIVATVAVILIYVLPYMAALPGLRYGRGFVVRQTSFMISNTIPAGGAIGLAVQYEMLTGYGYGSAPSTAAIGITSVWNTFITLALPILALAGLVFTGEAASVSVAAAVLGLVVLVVAVLVFALILRNESTARRIGDWVGAALGWLAGIVHRQVDADIGRALVEFRDSIVDVVSVRWVAITAANLGQQLAQFGVLWLALLGVQGGSSAVTLLEAFAAFAFARLTTFIPIPPGGLGTTDAALTVILEGFGVSDNDALAAVLIWRAATYFPQVFIGIGTFLVWRRQQRKGMARLGTT
jgi:putative heme transporter